MVDNSKGIRAFLSQGWIGPTISLIVLTVSVTSAIFTISTFVRQGNRFEVEDERLAPRVAATIEILNAKDGFMRGVIDVQSKRDVGLTVRSIEVISPAEMRLAACDCGGNPEGKPIPTTASNIISFETERIDAPPSNRTSSWGKVIWVKVSEPRRRDLVIRFNFRETAYPFRSISRSAAATVYDGMAPQN